MSDFGISFGKYCPRVDNFREDLAEFLCVGFLSSHEQECEMGDPGLMISQLLELAKAAGDSTRLEERGKLSGFILKQPDELIKLIEESTERPDFKVQALHVLL